MYVIDASVALKWLYKEIYQKEAIAYLYCKDRLVAPDFILYEYTGAIRRKVQLKEISIVEGSEGLKLFHAMQPLELFSTLELVDKAYSISNEIDHGVYDCFYLALAEQLNAQVVTADKRFFQNTSRNNKSLSLNLYQTHIASVT